MNKVIGQRSVPYEVTVLSGATSNIKNNRLLSFNEHFKLKEAKLYLVKNGQGTDSEYGISGYGDISVQKGNESIIIAASNLSECGIYSILNISFIKDFIEINKGDSLLLNSTIYNNIGRNTIICFIIFYAKIL